MDIFSSKSTFDTKGMSLLTIGQSQVLAWLYAKLIC